MPIELNLRKQKWLLLVIYRPPDQNLAYFSEFLSGLLDFYSVNYENFVIMGDFNSECYSTEISDLVSFHEMNSLITGPTCFKSAAGRCIDLILTNKRKSFQKSSSFETGISDYHHMIFTVLKTTHSNVPIPFLQIFL